MLNSMAKVKANTVYHEVCHHGIVLHGAVGWTEEMDIGLYHIRTKAGQFDGGLSDLHLERTVGFRKGSHVVGIKGLGLAGSRNAQKSGEQPELGFGPIHESTGATCDHPSLRLEQMYPIDVIALVPYQVGRRIEARACTSGKN